MPTWVIIVIIFIIFLALIVILISINTNNINNDNKNKNLVYLQVPPANNVSINNQPKPTNINNPLKPIRVDNNKDFATAFTQLDEKNDTKIVQNGIGNFDDTDYTTTDILDFTHDQGDNIDLDLDKGNRHKQDNIKIDLTNKHYKHRQDNINIDLGKRHHNKDDLSIDLNLPKDGKRANDDNLGLPKNGKRANNDSLDLPKDGKRANDDSILHLPRDGKRANDDSLDLPRDGKRVNDDSLDLPKDGKRVNDDALHLPRGNRKADDSILDLPRDGRKADDSTLGLPRESRVDNNATNMHLPKDDKGKTRDYGLHRRGVKPKDDTSKHTKTTINPNFSTKPKQYNGNIDFDDKSKNTDRFDDVFGSLSSEKPTESATNMAIPKVGDKKGNSNVKLNKSSKDHVGCNNAINLVDNSDDNSDPFTAVPDDCDDDMLGQVNIQNVGFDANDKDVDLESGELMRQAANGGLKNNKTDVQQFGQPLNIVNGDMVNDNYELDQPVSRDLTEKLAMINQPVSPSSPLTIVNKSKGTLATKTTIEVDKNVLSTKVDKGKNVLPIKVDKDALLLEPIESNKIENYDLYMLINDKQIPIHLPLVDNEKVASVSQYRGNPAIITNLAMYVLGAPPKLDIFKFDKSYNITDAIRFVIETSIDNQITTLEGFCALVGGDMVHMVMENNNA